MEHKNQREPGLLGRAQSRVVRQGYLDRQYRLFVPSVSAAGGAALPLVVMLHGAGDTSKGAMRQTGWLEKAEYERFLAAFPDALRPFADRAASFEDNPQIWNDGSRRGYAFEKGIDDAGFINAVIEACCADFNVDSRRIYITGFSNGAGMAFRVGAQLSARIAAIAPVAGHFWADITRIDSPVSMLYIAGSVDKLNPLEGGEIKVPWGAVRKPPVADSVWKWAELIKCPKEPRTELKNAGVEQISYGPGLDDAEVNYFIVSGMGHVWPGGKSFLPKEMAGPLVKNFSATDVIWDFFANHPKPVRAEI